MSAAAQRNAFQGGHIASSRLFLLLRHMVAEASSMRNRTPTCHVSRRPDEAAPPTVVIPREGGGTSTPRLIDSITAVSGILDHPPSRVTTTEYGAAISRHDFARALQIRCPSSKNRGRRECRVRAAPAVSCAKKLHIGAHEHTGQRRTLRHPLRNGFTAYFVLSPVSEFVLSPSSAGNFPRAWHQQRVSGPHDLAVRSGVSSGA